jgi:hypothetical protein
MSNLYGRYTRPVYERTRYNLNILRPKTSRPRWYEMDPIEKQRELTRAQRQLAGMEEVPDYRKTLRERIKQAAKPMVSTIKVIMNDDFRGCNAVSRRGTGI